MLLLLPMRVDRGSRQQLEESTAKVEEQLQAVTETVIALVVTDSVSRPHVDLCCECVGCPILGGNRKS